MEIATFAAGCFWGIEAIFRQLKGVEKTTVGYLGGTLENPTYEDVCSDKTGHAEVVEITYDPVHISYQDLLETFWNNHNPTMLNRQGPDIGAQYRSAIFYHNETQQEIARQSKESVQKSGKYGNHAIVTEITAAGTFYKAEEYHQQYLEKRGVEACHITNNQEVFKSVLSN